MDKRSKLRELEEERLETIKKVNEDYLKKKDKIRGIYPELEDFSFDLITDAKYCVRDKNGRSPILRKQWAESIEEGVKKMWELLSGGVDIGDGSFALRNDLDTGRGFASLVGAMYNPPFNSIENNTNCDISDNGLIEIDISNYKKWVVFHIEIGNWHELKRTNKDFDKMSCNKRQKLLDWSGEYKKTKIAQMDEKGFKWLVTERTRERLGEGLF